MSLWDPASLPPEIVSDILFKAIGERLDRLYNALSYSHVCRRWREIALDYPPLWADIIDLSPAAVHQILPRTKRSPLFVRYALGDNPILAFEPFIALIATIIERTRYLYLQGSSECLTTFFTMALTPAPLLESLCLTTPQTWSGPTRTLRFIPESLPFRVTQLRNVHLDGVKPPISTSFFDRLVNLRIEMARSDSWADIFSIVSSSPFLQSLALLDSLPRVQSVPGAQRIQLRKLRRLDLTDDVSLCALFLTHATIPLQAKIRLSLRRISVRGADHVLKVMRFLGSRCSMDGSTLFRSSYVVDERPKLVKLRLYWVDCGVLPTQPPDIIVELYLAGYNPGDCWWLQALPMDSLKSLTLAGSLTYDALVWRTIFAAARQLEHVHIPQSHLPTLVATYVLRDENELPMTLPILKTLSIRGLLNDITKIPTLLSVWRSADHNLEELCVELHGECATEQALESMEPLQNQLRRLVGGVTVVVASAFPEADWSGWQWKDLEEELGIEYLPFQPPWLKKVYVPS